MPVVGRISDRFELKSQAGTGGMGTVYQAIDRDGGAVVAVKVLHAKSLTDAARFAQEAALLAELRHPAIVRYIHHGTTVHGEAYIAMEWLDGETLEDRLVRGPITAANAALLAARVLAALSAAHKAGVIHRDIKPSNIFLVGWRFSNIRILDFGIARKVLDPKRFTKQGSTVGTPLYAAPEQARGDRTVDARADIFSLGCVLYESLAGQPPFTGSSPMEVMTKICVGSFTPLGQVAPGVPSEVDNLIERMLAQDRRKRPGDAGELSASFEAVAGALGGGDDVRAVATPRGARETLSDGEQRSLVALVLTAEEQVVPEAAASGASASSPYRERLPPRRTQPQGPGDIREATDTPADLAARIEDLVRPFGGRVDRLLDRSLVVTTATTGPLADQAEPIARAALAVSVGFPRVRMALGAGRAVMLAHLPVGDIIDRLTDLVALTRRGVISVDATCARLLSRTFAIQGLGGACELIAARDGAVTGPDQPVGTATVPFLGRDRELGLLASLFEECVEEQVARVALVMGVAGAGKSRLGRELVARVRGDVTGPEVLWCEPRSRRQGVRFAMLHDLLRAAGVDPGATTVDAAEAAITRHLKALSGQRPVLLVLENLHLADLASVQIVDAVARTLRDRSLLVLGLGRPEVDEQFPGLWNERNPERIRLSPLPRRVGLALVGAYMPGAAAEIGNFVLEHWEGNPGHLEDLVRANGDRPPRIPEGVLAVLEARLDVFGDDAKRFLRAASLFGETFPLEGAIALLGERSRRTVGEWVEVLVERDVIKRCGGEDVAFSWCSQVLRAAAFETLSPGDRTLGQRLARAFLENMGKTLPESLMAQVVGGHVHLRPLT